MLIFSSLFLLLSNAVTLRRDKSILFSRSSIISFIYCNSLTLSIIYFLSLAKGISLYGGLFHISSLTQIFYIFIFLISACILQLTGFYPRKITTENFFSWFNLFSCKLSLSKIAITNIINKMANQFKIIEYSLIIIFIIIGATFLMSANDLVSIFLAIELQSYGLYLLSTLYKDSEKSTSGGLTYFLLGGLSSCLILLGTGLLYIYSGTTSLDVLYGMTSISEITYNNFFNQYNAYYINFSFIIISVGFLFKISAAPFHFWSPDVYDAIPTIVTTFVAIIAKISILLFFLELIHYTSDLLFMYKYNWTNSILLSCLLSLIIGTVLGLSQSRIKRLFAYSTISHIGFILLALAINSIESTQAFIFYLMQYSVSNLNAFIILLTIGFSLYYFVYDNKVIKVLSDKDNSPIQLINQLKGYFYINPIISLAFAITIFSFAGIPPLIGFFAKQMVLSAALDSGYIFLTFVAILTSVIGAVYYLGIIKQMFFDKNEYILSTQLETDDFKLKSSIDFNNENKQYTYINVDNIVISSYLSITISILTLIILLFILIPQEWLSMANIVALILFNSS